MTPKNPAGTGGRRPSSGRLALLLLWLPYAALAWRFRFVTDDAFITFRYARNLALGNGPRFNLGVEPPVEGYSNFLWMLLGAGFERLGLDVATAACLVSFACGLLLLLRVHRALSRELELAAAPAFLGAAALALHPPFVVWSTGGLATVPYALLLFVGFELTCLRKGPPRPLSTGLVLLALALVRVEGGLWALAFLLLEPLARRLRGERPARSAVRRFGAAAIVLGGFLAWWAWRAAYYRAALPNTLYVKAGLSLARLGRGLDYVLANELAVLTPLLLLPATACALRAGRRAWGLPLVLAAWSFPLWSWATGGDYMTFGRFLVPGAAFTSLLIGLLAQDLAGPAARGARAGLAHALVALVVLAGALPLADHTAVPESVLARFDFRETGDTDEPGARPQRFLSEHAQWENQRANAARWAELGCALRFWVPPGSSLVLATIGATGYYSELFVHDRHGLVTAAVARMEVTEEGRALAGHEKGVPLEYFLPADPDVLLAGVTTGLPNHELGWSEDRSRTFFVDRFRLFYFKAALGRGIADRYVPEFLPVPPEESVEVQPFLTYLRRIGPEEDAEELWAEIDRRLARYLEDGPEPSPSFEGYPPRPIAWVPRD